MNRATAIGDQKRTEREEEEEEKTGERQIQGKRHRRRNCFTFFLLR